MRNILVLCLLSFCLISCKESEKERLQNLVREWEGKEILFPAISHFSVSGQDTINGFVRKTDYSIISYADSIGCISCKLRLNDWSKWIQQLDSVTGSSAPVYFFFHPTTMAEMKRVLRMYNFRYPVYIDSNDFINLLNHFPSDMTIQTFLLDKDNKVLAIGNPVHNPKVKELYPAWITRKKSRLISLSCARWVRNN